MCKTRHSIFPAKSLIEKNMQRCTWQPLLTTDNVSNLHQVVVNNICQMISWQFISTLIENLIVEDIALNANLTTYHIIYKNLLTWFNLEANCILLTLVNELLNLLSWESERVTHLHTSMSIVLEILNFSTFSFKLLWSIKSIISLTSIKKLLNILLVDVTTFTLTVRTMLTTEAYALIKLDAEPLKRFKNILFCSRNKTMRISVFYSEYKLATMLTSKQIVIKGGTYTANVQSARWAWCETHSYFSFCHSI